MSELKSQRGTKDDDTGQYGTFHDRLIRPKRNFEFFIELKVGNLVHLGYPKIPIRDTTTKLVRWGSKVE